MSSRDSRPGSAPARAATRRSDGAGRPGRPRPGLDPLPTARRGSVPRGGQDAPKGAAARDGLVVGTVPVVARVAGALLVLAGLAGAAGAFPTYLVVGGQAVTTVSGVGTALVALVVPGTDLVMGAVLLRGRVPKFGLAFAAVSGALAVGALLIEIYRAGTSTARPATEVIAGRQVLTSSVDVRPGWALGVLALVLTVAAGCVAAAAWGRTVMEDGGALDRVRGPLAGAAVLLGVGTVLCLVLPASDMPDRVVTDPSTGMQTVVTREGPQALLERPGLALLGGLLLAGAVVLCSVVAPSLRPRLATVGALLAITVSVTSAALEGLRDAVLSTDLEWTVPGMGLLVTAIGYGVLTVLAWRLRRSAVTVPRS